MTTKLTKANVVRNWHTFEDGWHLVEPAPEKSRDSALWIHHRDFDTVCDERDELESQVRDLTGERERIAKLACHALTPGGSEFVNDAKYCIEYAGRRLNTLQDLLKESVKDRNGLRDNVERLERELKEARNVSR